MASSQQETVYGNMTTSMSSESGAGHTSSNSSDSHAVMNEKVQAIAGTVYEEFERMIGKYDQDVVKNLMPLIVNVLENLDLSYTETQELEVECELLKEDNEQLVTQYEREKQLRKGAEGKLLEIEDLNDGERKDAMMKIDSLTSIVKMFELKTKNFQDQISRLEEKESENKKEYTKLHERYSELFKTHLEYMEKTKSMLGAEKLEQQGFGVSRPRIAGMALNQLNRSSGPVSFGYAELENNNAQQASILTDFASQTTPGVDRSNVSLKNELKSPMELNKSPSKPTNVGGWIRTTNQESEVVDLELDETEDISQDKSIGPESPSTPLAPSKSQTKTETRTGNNLYQELSFQDSEALCDVDEGADITGGWVHPGDFASAGMGKEVENLITENNELLATKNALNIVKDDLIAKVDELTGEHEILREEIKSLQEVRTKLQQKVTDLEDELKKTKEEYEKVKTTKTEEDEDVPMAQRKRFTRVEMARVLMERNQYKERFMELQEAVRWTEMIRASRADPGGSLEKKSSGGGNNRGIWKFFGNLFSGTERLGDPMAPIVNMKYTGAAEEATPALTRERKALRSPTSTNDVFDGDTLSTASGEAKRSKVNERKEQYKQVRAHVKKEDGRMQAYGWSLPAQKSSVASTPTSDDSGSSSSKMGTSVPVPVPVYCRPLMEKEPGMKIWCAAGVDNSGGRTKDGGSIVGASVFYHEPPASERKSKTDELEDLDSELQSGSRNVEEAAKEQQNLSSLVWICTSTHAISKVTVIDANSPADVLESFHVCSSHLLCIASVPGAKEDDYKVDEELNKLVVEESELRELDEAKRKAKLLNEGHELDEEEVSGIGAISFVSCATGSESTKLDVDEEPIETKPRLTKERAFVLDEPKPEVSEDTDAVHRRFLKEPSDKVKDGVSEISKANEIAFSEIEKMSSVLPTMWLGSQSGSIYVHSAVSQWKRCIHSIRLKDSVLSIVHVKGRVMAALANGTVAIFHRAPDGQWDLLNYHVLDLGQPRASIRCMIRVHNKVWCGYRNKIFEINPKTMTVDMTFDAHPRKESQVRQMAWVGDGVWVSIRLDSTLRLYHAHTHEHLQDVDVEPYVSKMLGTGKLGFSFVRITSLLVSCNRLWMGTGNGVIISVPLNDNKPSKSQQYNDALENKGPGKVLRVYSDSKNDVMTAETFIPFCSMAQAQLSFHGHRDAVKFFVSVPGHGGLTSGSALTSPTSTRPQPPSPPKCIEGKEHVSSMLVMSGGEGYIDFRIGDPESTEGNSRNERSHLVVWQVPLVQDTTILDDEDD